MSVEQEVANLTAAINTLTDTVNVRKAVLDQAVDDAETLAGQADGSRQAAETAAQESAASKSGADATKALMDTALANVTDYSNTLGLLSPAAKEIVAAADVVAVFIYDTTKDSDGGKWRKRCRHTSWYNETLGTATRGSRRGFPQKALIVVRAASVTIYDLDTAGCPMWRVFSKAGTTIANAHHIGLAAYTLSAAFASLGKIMIAGTTLTILDLVVDRSEHYSSTAGNSGYSNAPLATEGQGWTGNQLNPIVNATVNAVAATVLPGTPIDPVRGLPNPTIAVGTAGGVSVVHWDGRVCNSVETQSISRIAFADDATLWFSFTSTAVGFSPAPEYAVTAFINRYYSGSLGVPQVFGSTATALATRKGAMVKGSTLGLDVLEHTPGSGVAAGYQNNRSAVAKITSKYNTGHLIGDIKAALAESTADLTSLVEATPLNDDFSSYADTAAMLAAGWTAVNGATLELESGALKVTSNSGYGAAQRIIPASLIVGRAYTVEIDMASTYNTSLQINGENVVGVGVNNGTKKVGFIATSTTLTLVAVINSISGRVATFDNIRIRLAATDRSVAGNHPVVKGTITRAAVATGAELAAYGGFSASNYLEMPLSGLLGTGDFCVDFWMSAAAAGSTANLFSFLDASDQFVLVISKRTNSGDGGIEVNGYNPAATKVAEAIDNTQSGLGRFIRVSIVRRAGVVEIWRDGSRMVTNTDADWPSVNLANATKLRIGNDSDASTASLLMALPRSSATAPTPAQIRAAYEDERLLFQPNAKCLLPGDNVSALAYDDSTELLHVATTAGSARLRGLLVVDKDATVYTGIDAKAGIVATRDSGSADIVLPSIPLREAAAAGIGHNGGPSLYDRRTVRASGVTTNATPTVIARFPMDKGEFGQWVIRTVAKEYDSGAELAAYEDVLLARRPGEGNVAISGSVTQRVIQEVTSSMAVTIAANTTTQCIEVTATGVASKNIEWTVEGRLA